jgi:ABC-type Na+ efflux pump permease subunit
MSSRTSLAPVLASLRVAAKELRASLRDRNTVLYSVVLPLCLYPVLFWAMIQVALLVQGRREQTTAGLELWTAPGVVLPQDLEARLRGEAIDGRDEPKLALTVSERKDPSADASAAARAHLEHGQRAQEDHGQAVLWIPGTPGSAALYFDSTRALSRLAQERAQARLERFVERERERALAARRLSLEALHPFERVQVDVAPPRDKLAYVLSFILPMLLVTMCVLGAFFPAVDLTAGEKERQTEETTLLLPVPRYAVQQGKILAVCATAVLATGCNLLALGLSASHLLAMLGSEFGGGLGSVPLLALLAVAPLAVLFSFFVAAVLTGVASFARTFKEGQALLGPAQLVFILPAMIGVIPGVQYGVALACVPVVNVVLAFRGLLQGRVQPALYALTVLSLLFLAVASIRLSVWLLSREGAPDWRALFRRSARP